MRQSCGRRLARFGQRMTSTAAFFVDDKDNAKQPQGIKKPTSSAWATEPAGKGTKHLIAIHGVITAVRSTILYILLPAASFFACVSVAVSGPCQPPPSARIRLTVERARSPSS